MPHVSLHSDGKVSIKVDSHEDAALVSKALIAAFPDLFDREGLDRLALLSRYIDARLFGGRSPDEPVHVNTPADVYVFGPNLSSAGQRKGDMHVHAVGCSDCKHYGPGRKFGGDDTVENSHSLSIASRKEAVLHIYADHGADDDNWEEFDDLYFFPCLKGLR